MFREYFLLYMLQTLPKKNQNNNNKKKDQFQQITLPTPASATP